MIIIGESLNGSIPAVGEAIAKKDSSFIQERARVQTDAGAHYIDVCASVLPDREPAALRWMMELVQKVTDTPLCIDSPDPRIILAAMQDAKRPGMLNSVSMERDKTDVLFPAIAGTQWNCIALLCDSSGIPQDADGRLAVLERILQQADRYSVQHERLFIDPLVSSLSVSDRACTVFLECCRQIRLLHPEVHIVSGLSNISFGLPARKRLHHAFAILAEQAGMDAAILNPADADLKALLSAADALLGKDPGCAAYISLNGNRAEPAAPPPPPAVQEDPVLAAVRQAVMDGDIAGCPAAVQAALDAGCAPDQILNLSMSPAMNSLGEAFSKGDVFVPELMMAAKAMKKGVAILKPLLAGDSVPARGTAVIGTVAGDMHDIGKNLVAMMLESSGFQVLDLGVDVPAADFVRSATENADVRIVALSSLLTTTLPAMQASVQALRAVPDRKFSIFVGGAPVTEDFARSIGADRYTKDAAEAAAEAVRIVSA